MIELARRHRRTIVGVLSMLLCSAMSAAMAAPQDAPGDIPDFTRGGTRPEQATHDWNLGPTGARGWMYSRKMETSEARQILVTEVATGSPADGVLRPGDVILGLGQDPFESDPRTAFGRAIGAAEAGSGRLGVLRWREGRTRTVAIRLPRLGAYAPTAPFDCRKSERIFESGCEAIAARMQANPNAGNPIERCYNALALLASGRPEYMPLIQHQVEWAAGYSDLERRQLHSWWYGPVNLLLAEYVLATGDDRVRPHLERVTMEIVRGQSEVGSWGHRFIQSNNGRLAGYGMMNAPGLPLTLSLVIARDAGVRNDEIDRAIDRAAGLIRFYVGKGCVPYGDHAPWIDTHDDNGKNGAAAVLFNLLGDAEAAEYFSRMSVASHGGERDEGHTGNYFNMLWAMPGVALSGPNASGAWMEEFGWAYDLARRWDGSVRHQGPPQVRPDSYDGWDATGAFMLAYAQPRRALHLAGRIPSVAPQVDASTAASLIEDGRGWSPSTKIAAFAARPDDAILDGLASWSPIVRERCGMELARRDGDRIEALRVLLQDERLEARLGAAVALAHHGPRAAPAVDDLREALHADDLWLRVKAAEALAKIGPAAIDALPDLLGMLADPDLSADPRAMEQRYLCFALFDRRDGMLGRSLDGVDRPQLLRAVAAGLRNEDGRARGTLGSVYRNLELSELEPLLPSILDAIREPSPSGIMFADGIRLEGLDLLAKHGIAEGLPFCIDLIDPDRWGMGNRIERCLNALRTYGPAAKSELQNLRALHEALVGRKWNPDRLARLDIPARIAEIEAMEGTADLRSITPRP